MPDCQSLQRKLFGEKHFYAISSERVREQRCRKYHIPTYLVVGNRGLVYNVDRKAGVRDDLRKVLSKYSKMIPLPEMFCSVFRCDNGGVFVSLQKVVLLRYCKNSKAILR